MAGLTNYHDVLSSFSGKKVFITGHTGFKGSWLTFLLTEVGAQVKGFALPPETSINHFDLLKLSNKIEHIEGDIRDAALLKQEVEAFQPEYVFHLAAQALVKKSYADPSGTFDTNVMGSVNLLEAVRHCPSVRSLVYITSDKCYENVEWLWGYRENDTLGGRDPYSASKAAAELIFSAYVRSYFNTRSDLGVASVRAGNVIGGGDWAADRIIPDCIRAFEQNKEVILRNPNATRPWQHVLEPLSGYLLLAVKLRENVTKYKGAWNFGPNASDVMTVETVVMKIIQHFGMGALTVDRHHHPHEAGLLQLNCDKAHQLLSWHPRWSTNKTLQETALWYKRLRAGENAIDVTRAQLHDYFPELL